MANVALKVSPIMGAIFRRVLLPSLVLLLCACSTAGGPALKFSPRFDTQAQAIAHNKLRAKQEAPILFVADNQQTMVESRGVFEQSRLAEVTAGTAHRRPALELFSIEIMKKLIEDKKPRLILHGGDLLNNSCQSEMQRAVEVLAASEIPWYIAPGNHDGYYLGLASPNNISRSKLASATWVTNERGMWAKNCTATVDGDEEGYFGFRYLPDYGKYHANVVDKIEFIYRYLLALGIIKKGERQLGSSSLADFGNPLEEKLGERYIGFSFGKVVDLAGVHPLSGATDPRSPGYTGQVERGVGRLAGDPRKIKGKYRQYCIDFTVDDNEAKQKRLKTPKFLQHLCWTKSAENERDGNVFRPEFVFSRDSKQQFSEPEPWRNFLVQHLSVPVAGREMDVILLDTSAYTGNKPIKSNGDAPWGSQGAAGHGHIHSAQQDIIDGWLANASSGEKARPILLVGHHPIADLDETSYDFIEKLFAEYNVIRYVSGDTHDGYDGSLRRRGSRDDGAKHVVRESNIGAMIDAPIEYALIGATTDELKKNGGQEVDLFRYSLTPLENDGHNRSSSRKIPRGFDRPKLKRASHDNALKTYAEFDHSLWSDYCATENFTKANSRCLAGFQKPALNIREYRANKERYRRLVHAEKSCEAESDSATEHPIKRRGLRAKLFTSSSATTAAGCLPVSRCAEHYHDSRPYEDSRGMDPLRLNQFSNRYFGASFDQFNIWQPMNYLGLPYLLSFYRSNTDVSDKALNAYKINRLTAMAEVYRKLFIYLADGAENFDNCFGSSEESEGEKTNSILSRKRSLERKVYLSLKELDGHNFSAYGEAHNDHFTEVTSNLVALLSVYKEMDKSLSSAKCAAEGADAQRYKVCSALFEAEREY